VGAAVLAGGAVHAGANVENASYGLTLCAERAAVAAAVAAGARRLAAVAVATGTAEPTPPCGACLQTLAEFGDADLPVVLAGAGGRRVETRLGALLPRAFSKRFL
jgi:cytidine deaminase